MKTEEGKVLLIHLDENQHLQDLQEADDCYTRAESYDDLIIDVDILQGSDELRKVFRDVTGFKYKSVEEYQYIVCWR